VNGKVAQISKSAVSPISNRQKANKSFAMFDKVNGTDATRKALQAGTSAAQIVASWKAGEDAFRKQRRKYLMY
jgi:uncharacterized protein YbbC (DUF1343 family)